MYIAASRLRYTWVREISNINATQMLLVHRKKRFASFPSPAVTKLSLGVNNDVITKLFLPRGVWLVTSRLETGNSWTFFYGVDAVYDHYLISFLGRLARYILFDYGPMIYTVSYVMVLMRADSLLEQIGGGWALEIETFLGPEKCHRAVRRASYVVILRDMKLDSYRVGDIKWWWGRIKGVQKGAFRIFFEFLLIVGSVLKQYCRKEINKTMEEKLLSMRGRETNKQRMKWYRKPLSMI